MNILGCIDKDKCSGCGACHNICPCKAIVFKADKNGFTYPHIDESLCVECGQCVAACQKATEAKKNLPIKAFAATNRNKTVLRNSSSGGVFSVLAEHVLSKNGVVCGCVFDSELNPIHICAEKEKDYLRMRRSKYVQSDVGLVYQQIKEYLKTGRTVLFAGTPCQVAALLAVVGTGHSELITVDLICHGVPSRLMFQKFLEYLEKKYRTKIVDFNFRSKKYGWQRFTMEFQDNKGRIRNIGKANEFYFPAFTAGYIMRNSCYTCNFACPERVGDITLGDFWGHERLDGTHDSANGISLCTINTANAEKLIPVLSEGVTLEEIDYRIAVSGNTCLRNPSKKGKEWDRYMQALENDNISEIAKKYIQKHKLAILRGRIKNAVPLWFFNLTKKRRAHRQKSAR